MDDYDKLRLQKNKIESERIKQYKDSSKERFKKIATTKIRTAMIGSLDAIEKRLKKYWETDKPTNEGLFLKQIYEEIRNEILDKGNQQIRNLEIELEQYDIEWKRYTIQLPVKPLPENILKTIKEEKDGRFDSNKIQ